MPTVLELTQEQRRHYIKSLRHRAPLPELTPTEIKERELLLENARKAAAILKIRFGAKKVILFGSLAHGEWFAPKSDIDLAVEGLDADSYWKSWRVIEQIITDRFVDLVELETARESLREDIQQYGIIL